MKQITYFLMITLFVTTVGCAQNENSNDAEMIFKDGQEHDFGKIQYDGDGSFEFEFKNTGKVPLIITNVKSSCGCTVPTYPKEPIKKKGKASIKVKYDTKRVGTFTKTITVYSNAKNSPITLRIKGEVVKNK